MANTVRSNGKLTAKQERFVGEYLIDLNAAQAAIRAGYSKHTAAAIGYENLRKPHILGAIERRRAALRAQAHAEGVTPEAIVEEYRRIGFSSLTDVVSWDDEGDTTLFASKDLDRGVVVAIKKVRHRKTEILNKEGDVIRIHHDREIEMHSKRAALDGLVRVLGYEKQPEEKGDKILVINNIMQYQGADG